jgi:hypothetical protein
MAALEIVARCREQICPQQRHRTALTGLVAAKISA